MEEVKANKQTKAKQTNKKHWGQGFVPVLSVYGVSSHGYRVDPCHCGIDETKSYTVNNIVDQQ